MKEKEIIVAVSENKVRAVVEKRYYLNDKLHDKRDELVRSNNGEAYFNLFLGFYFSLTRRFEGYSHRKGIDVKEDGSGFFGVPVYATCEEVEEIYTKIMDMIHPRTDPHLRCPEISHACDSRDPVKKRLMRGIPYGKIYELSYRNTHMQGS